MQMEYIYIFCSFMSQPVGQYMGWYEFVHIQRTSQLIGSK